MNPSKGTDLLQLALHDGQGARIHRRGARVRAPRRETDRSRCAATNGSSAAPAARSAA
jgi:hypothetical protein